MDLRLAEKRQSECQPEMGRRHCDTLQMVNGYQKQTLKEDSGNAGSESGMTGKKHLNFGIESILQSVNAKTQMNHDNVKGLNDKCSSGVISSVFSNKVESSFLPGWYNRFWPVLHRENTTNLCKADIDINWQMKDAQRDKFCLARRVGHPYQNRSPPKRKKPRTSFTRITVMELEKRFERQKYLASSERSTLAKSLKISDSQVKTWFQNRRTKWRRQAAEEKELERQSTNRLLMSMTSYSSKQMQLFNDLSSKSSVG